MNQLHQLYLTNVEDIFATNIEIIGTTLKTDYVEIDCSKCEYGGGIISLACEDIIVFDHESRIITVDELDRICREYWDNF